jgi:type IV fimbrial biogenesis protein FimT
MSSTAMSTWRIKSGAEMRQSRQNRIPFIGLLVPFVGRNQPRIQPFVGPIEPLVPFQRNSGFTLIELIVTLVIAAILLSLAAPSMTSFIRRDRLVTQANELVADLSLTRSEAIKRGFPVTICKTADASASPPQCITGNDSAPWTDGRIVFVDTDGSGQVNGTEAVLRVRQELDGATDNGNRLLGDGTASGTANRAVFNAVGTTSLTQTTSWILCDNRGASEGVAIAITMTGRPRITEKGKDYDDSTLSC